jgi:hypothetical protein
MDEKLTFIGHRLVDGVSSEWVKPLPVDIGSPRLCDYP